MATVSGVNRFATFQPASFPAQKSQTQTLPKQTGDIVSLQQPRFGNSDNAGDIASLKEQIKGLSDQVMALLKRTALIENRTDLPKIASKVAPATVSIAFPGGGGSGFWIKCRDGVPRIVTNAHVAMKQPQVQQDIFGQLFTKPDDGEPIHSRFSIGLYNESDLDGQVKIPGQVKLLDARTYAINEKLDIAILEPADPDFKLPGHIQPLEFENYKENGPEVGELVFKVGNALQMPGAVAMGVVSRVGRNMDKIVNMRNAATSIQTDTPINPGDSGGPLVNMEGKVIGVNNMKLGRAEGMGFSIPAPYVVQLLRAWDLLD